MKKISVWLCLLFLLMSFIDIPDVKASQSAPYSPKKFEITIKNVSENDIQSIDVIYKTFSFSYSKEEESEIRNYSTEEINEIAIEKLHLRDLEAKSIRETDGYWLEMDYGSYSELEKVKNGGYLVKWAINTEVSKEFNDNSIVITAPTYQNSESKMMIEGFSYIRIVTKDGTELYSKAVDSKLTKYLDEFSDLEKIKEAEDTLNIEAAYFEVDYNEIANNFEVTEIFKEDYDDHDQIEIDNKKENKEGDPDENARGFVIATIVASGSVVMVLLASLLCKKKKKS